MSLSFTQRRQRLHTVEMSCSDHRSSKQRHLPCAETAAVLVNDKLHRGAWQQLRDTLGQVFLGHIDLPAPHTGRWVVDIRARLDPTMRLLPLHDLAGQPLLRDELTGRGGAGVLVRRALPDPASIVAAPIAFTSLALAFSLSFVFLAFPFRFAGFFGELRVGQDLAQSDLRRTLLGLLLSAADLASPASGRPSPRQGSQPHGGLVAPSDLHAVVDGLALLQIALGDLHAQGVQLGLGRDSRVLTLLCLSLLLHSQLLGRQ
mmetsp:Transcript_54422/g.156504  ORF Transcript_54422/g.156504 Transcript_54422/m.156504 type:complete len:260 (+) Transcript_54422:102-881(+)